MKPHVILITTDQQRRDTLECCGDALGLTPCLNVFANEGVRFPNAYTPNPACVPARLAALTGCMPHRATSEPSGWGSKRAEVPALPELLAAAGYQSAAIGKMHFLPYANPRTLHGFGHAELNEEGRILEIERRSGTALGGEDYHDYLREVGWAGYERAHGIGNNDIRLAPSPLPAEHYESSWVVNRSLNWVNTMRTQSPDTPLFLWASFTRPHPPFDPPEPWHRTFDPRRIPAPRGSREGLNHKNPVLRMLPRSYGWEDSASPEHVRLIRAYYYGLVRFLDAQVGALLAGLKEAGVYDDALIIFTSDHGEMLGDHGLFFKACLLEPSVGIPLLVRFPGGWQSGAAYPGLVGLEDIVPTVLSACESEASYPMDGLAWQSLLDGSRSERSVYVSHAFNQGMHSFMLRHGQWKYIYNEADGFEELYSLESDPHELFNCATAESQVAANLRAMLGEWCNQKGDARLAKNGQWICTPSASLSGAKNPHALHGVRWY